MTRPLPRYIYRKKISVLALLCELIHPKIKFLAFPFCKQFRASMQRSLQSDGTELHRIVPFRVTLGDAVGSQRLGIGSFGTPILLLKNGISSATVFPSRFYKGILHFEVVH